MGWIVDDLVEAGGIGGALKIDHRSADPELTGMMLIERLTLMQVAQACGASTNDRQIFHYAETFRQSCATLVHRQQPAKWDVLRPR